MVKQQLSVVWKLEIIVVPNTMPVPICRAETNRPTDSVYAVGAALVGTKFEGMRIRR